MPDGVVTFYGVPSTREGTWESRAKYKPPIETPANEFDYTYVPESSEQIEEESEVVNED